VCLSDAIEGASEAEMPQELEPGWLIGSEFKIADIRPARAQTGPDFAFLNRSNRRTSQVERQRRYPSFRHLHHQSVNMQDDFLSRIITEARDVIISPS